MSKTVQHQTTVTLSDLDSLPAMLSTREVAEIRRSSLRNVQNRAEALGGVRVDGRWLFPTHRVLADLHLA